jgi:Uma2 family endonuclease
MSRRADPVDVALSSGMTAATRLLDFDALYARIRELPRGVTGEILEPGVLRTMSRPGRRHRRAAKNGYLSLQGFDEGAEGQGWWLEIEAEVRLDDRLAVPDLAGWRVARVPALPDDNPISVVPDWTCEVLSPSTRREDRVVKLPLYAEKGVAHVWLVDPDLRLVEVYETVRGRPLLAQSATDDAEVTLAPFDRPIRLASWWGPEDGA